MLALRSLSTFGIVLLALFFSPSESSDGDLWPSDWHFRVQLHRYSDRYCKDKVSKHQLLKAGHCLGKHPFTSLAYRVGKHMNYEKDWAKYGNCTLHTYEQPNCEGRELAFVPRANDPEQFADCFAGDEVSRSVRIICEIDGKQVNEVNPGVDDPFWCLDPDHKEECN